MSKVKKIAAKYSNLSNETKLQIASHVAKMSKLNKVEELKTKRFVIRKSLIGKNVVITFINKKGNKCTYNHDEVYYNNQERFDNMKCFQKYKSYTCTNNLPTFARS